MLLNVFGCLLLSLEEKFKSLREQGLSDVEIVRRIFEENVDADIDEIQRITGMEKLEIGRIKGQVVRWRRKREEEAGLAKEPSKETPPKPIEMETIEAAIEYIKERLQRVHGVGSADSLIISALQDDPTPLRDPNLLHAFIKNMAPKAYDSHLTMSVIRPLYIKFPNLASMVDKYLANIQGVQAPMQQYAPYIVPPQPSYYVPQYSYPVQPQTTVTFPYTPSPQTTIQPPTSYIQPPSAQPQPPTQYPFTFDRHVDERLRMFEDRVLRLIEERVKPKEEKEMLVDIEEEIPVRDKEGNVILDESGRAIVQRVKRRVPVSQATMFAPKVEDAEAKVLEKLKIYREIFEKREEAKPSITREDIELTVRKILEEKESKLTPEQVIQIVEEKLAERKPEEPEEIKRLRDELAESKKRLEELKETLTAQQRQILEERIKSLESEIRRLESLASGRMVEGYRSDEYRIIGQGLEKVASVLERKEPLKVVVEKAPELMSMVSGAVPQQPMVPQARVGLIEVLRQRGLTTPQ